jgi:hypothetical protein
VLNALRRQYDINTPANDFLGPRQARATAWASCALNSTAQSAGLSVNETKHEITVDAAIVTANWRKNSPEIPERKAEGTKTAHRVSAIEMSAPPTSSIVRWAASAGDIPDRRLRSTFSTKTIASSTTIPTARTNPNSDRLLIEMPSISRTMKVPSRDTGMAMTGMIVARQVWRKMNTTPTTRAIATKMVTMTSLTDFEMKIVGS